VKPFLLTVGFALWLYAVVYSIHQGQECQRTTCPAGFRPTLVHEAGMLECVCLADAQ
jgi:hypothetical protein